MLLVGVGVAVALIVSSRNLGSVWTLIYKLAIGAVWAESACL